MTFRPFFLIASVVVALSVSSHAAGNFRFESTGVGFDLGLVVPEDAHATLGWGGLMAFNFDLGQAGDLQIRPNLEFFLSGDRHQFVNNGGDYDLTLFEIAFNADFRYYFPLPRNITVRPFVGNGIAILTDIYSYDWYYAYQFRRDDSDVLIGPAFEFLGGVDFPFSNSIIGSAEIKARVGHLNAFKMNFAMTFLLGGRR